MEQAQQKPEMHPTQEVRFAVVMYGGISLAIYMNGVAQELGKMVRATAPSEDDVHHAALTDGKLDGTEKVYRKLGRMLSWGAAAKDPAEAEAGGLISTRFVVDVLSGSSADGINAVYLAKALANDQPMDELKKLWIKEGDLGVLINDKTSVEDLDHLDQQVPPRSLLNGTRMYWKLLQALDGMDDAPREADHAAARNVEELDLYVTATDMHGQPVKLQLADGVVEEYRHRSVFHFRYRDGAPNDFLRRDNPFLAFAARCTSAHPAAFEPMRLGDANRVLGSYPAGDRDDRVGSAEWQRFFKEYLRPVEDGDTEESLAKGFLERDFNDGGVLDNRPFRHATDTMPLHRAGIPVSRKLVYLDPTPESLRLEQEGNKPRPTVIENAWLSLSTLPRYEPIQEDLRRVLERNRLIERVSTIVEGMEESDFEGKKHGCSAAWKERRASVKRQAGYTNKKWDQTTMSDMIQARGLTWAGYQHLRVTEVTDDLAVLITRGAGLDDDSDQFRAVRHLVRAWREERYDPDGEDGKLTEHAFLRRFDVQWRLRRLKFVLARTNGMLAEHDNERFRKLVEQTIGPDLDAAGLNLGDTGPAFFEELRRALFAIREAMSGVQTELHRTRRSLWESREKESHEKHPLAEAIDGLGIEAADLESLLEPQTKSVLDVRAKAMYEQKKLRFEEFSRLIQKRVGKALKAASKKCNQVLPLLPALGLDPESSGDEVARRAVRFHYDDFASYDMISHPILYSTGVGEEMAQVDVFRISPRDAKSRIDEEGDGRRKLAGTKLNNFGAFFEEKFRENDILWGRLDGAERIITALLPLRDDKEKREELITEAHRAIVVEEVFAKGWDTEDKDEMRRLVAKAAAYDAAEAGEEASETVALLDASLKDSSVKDALKPVLQAGLRGQDPLKHFEERFREEYDATRRFDPQRLLLNAGRASRVFGDLLEGYPEERRLPDRGVVWVTRLARLFWLLVEVAVPGSLPSLIFRHGLKLLYVFEALMVLLGTLLLYPAIQQFGFVAFVATAAVHATVLFLQDAMSKKERGRGVRNGERRGDEARRVEKSRPRMAKYAFAVLLPFAVLGFVFVLAALGLNLPRSVVAFVTDPPGTEGSVWGTLARGALMLAVVASTMLLTLKGTRKRPQES